MQEVPAEPLVRRYFEQLAFTPDSVGGWIEGRGTDNYINERHDRAVGWIPVEGTYRHGIDESLTRYSYDPSGARRMVHHRDQSCRINTYGDSFTHCDQVNDGETWQEVLAAHIGEPIRNYGVSGHSVYQMYLRMRREEAKTPAPHLIVNIYNDDHLRSLYGWSSLNFLTRGRDAIREAIRRPTMPYVEVDPASGVLLERGNPCPTAESLFKLCDPGWVYERFRNVLPVEISVAVAALEDQTPEESRAEAHRIAREYGLTPPTPDLDHPREALEGLCTEAALFASMRIVTRMEEFAARHGKQILYVLSHTEKHLAGALRDGSRGDLPFVDFLKDKGLPFVDLMDGHMADFATSRLNVDEYIRRHYIGHYNPIGNHFAAFAIKDRLVELLEPKPVSYLA